MLYERICELKDKRNISMSEVERLAGLSKGTISKWRKATPTSISLQRVADVFGVTVDYLLHGENYDIDEFAWAIAEITHSPEWRNALVSMMKLSPERQLDLRNIITMYANENNFR